MRQLIALLAAMIVSGCILIPNKEKPWCLPKGKYKHQKQEFYIGVRCDY